jgi:hypothetical protein
VETARRTALRPALSPRLRRRDGQAVLAVVVAVTVVVAVCCWPLARLHPRLVDGVEILAALLHGLSGLLS